VSDDDLKPPSYDVVYKCKRCGDFIWGDERAAHMSQAHYVPMADVDKEFTLPTKVPPIVID
jgi:hypothetical protein